MKKLVQCAMCVFWEDSKLDKTTMIGTCKRYPPQLIPLRTGGGTRLARPRTEAHTSCGEGVARAAT